jgi:dienelactone hydrolase
MRITILVRFFFLFVSVLILTAAAPAMGARPGIGNPTEETTPMSCKRWDVDVDDFIQVADCTETTVTGHSEGNHELNFMVIRPWDAESKKGHKIPKNGYPVIVWANGWGWNNNAGETTTDGYKPGLIEWALNGEYIVVATNAWSVQESDVLRCLQWIVDQNEDPDSDYKTDKIGLAGHSQGGGAIIKAGDGEPNGFEITATIAMNPYGPGWVKSGKQDGPMLLIGGTNDTTTPTSSFLKVWDAIQANEIGGILAELIGGTHNDDAWAPEGENPALYDFGCYQDVTELWWKTFLIDSGTLDDFVDSLDPECEWTYESTGGFDL